MPPDVEAKIGQAFGKYVRSLDRDDVPETQRDQSLIDDWRAVYDGLTPSQKADCHELKTLIDDFQANVNLRIDLDREALDSLRDFESRSKPS